MEDDDFNMIESEEIQEVAEPDVLSEEGQEVAEPANVEETNEEASGAEGSSDPPVQVTHTEADARFAEMRRINDAKTAQLSKYQQAFKKFGFEGETPEDALDAIDAHYSGKDIATVKAERLAAEQEAHRLKMLEDENSSLRNERNRQIIERDLKEVQKLDPNIKSITDLGQEFMQLKSMGWGTLEAYNAAKAARGTKEITPPPVIGKVNNNTTAKKDFYTSEEADKLSDEELNDPIIMKNVMKSMTKWK